MANNKQEKTSIVSTIIKEWRSKNPPGRFLARTDAASKGDSDWHDVGDEVS